MGLMNKPFPPDRTQTGLLAGIAAYTFWGVFPIYFKLTEAASPLEILAHRIVWSVVLAGLILFVTKQWRQVKTALKDKRKLLFLMLASVCIAMNWGMYIWAIQIDQIFQGSLGYYINPLMFMLVGTVFLGDVLTPLRCLAIACATIGVLILTFYGGQLPWIALILATSFTGYGVIRKQVDVAGLPGLFIETLCLFVPASLYLAYLYTTSSLTFLSVSPQLDFLLILAGLFTVLPLLAFSFAAKRLTLTTLGFLQFIGPTIQFGIGVWYGEALTPAHLWCFGFIWLAAAVFVADIVWSKRKTKKMAALRRPL